MVLGQVIQRAPSNQPQKSEQTRNNKCWTKTPAEVQPQNQERRHGTANRGAAIEQRRGQTALVFRKPLRNGFGCAWPVAGFAERQKKTESHERVKTPGKRRENGNNRIPQNGERESAFCSDAIHQPAVQSLS